MRESLAETGKWDEKINRCKVFQEFLDKLMVFISLTG